MTGDEPPAARRRTFRPEDQTLFAALSGDRNALHLDPDAARRTAFGVPVVHGMHLALWAIEAAELAEAPRAPALSVKLTNPTAVGEEVMAAAPEMTPDAVRLRITAGQRRLGLVTLGEAAAVADATELRPLLALPVTPPLVEPRDVSLAEAMGEAGHLRLPEAPSLSPVFPRATRLVGDGPAGAMAAASYIVGMACPGRHSLFMQLDLRAAALPIAGAGHAVYRVQSADPRFGLVDMDFATRDAVGAIRAVRRPPPVIQPSVAELRPHVAPGSFAGQRALIVGGSRGLGEVAAKLVALGDGEVVITYRRGRREAEAVAAEIGSACCILPYDVALPPEPQLAGLPFRPTHFYYFATPPIFRLKRADYEPAVFDEFRAVYVDGFVALAQALARFGPALVGFFPSSVAVDAPPAGLREYAAAKRAGETAAQALAAAEPRLVILSRRLPRVLTDQTGTVSPVATAAAVDVLLPIVRDLHAAGAR